MKLKVAVVFGGTNTEHEVSIVTAKSVMANLDPEKYEVLPVYITKSNLWTTLPPKEAAALPATVDQAITPTDLPGRQVDVIFPVLHGPYGEDGSIQGLLKMLHLPFVGNDVLSSALCMDKVVQKQLCLQQGLPIVPFAFTTQYDWKNEQDKTLQYVANKLTYPLFVKPANQGSSVGISKVGSFSGLVPAIDEAFLYDTKVIIEQSVNHAREIECSVLGNHQPEASVLGEIIPSNEFYDYDAKYVDGHSEAIIPAKLPPPVAAKIRQLAIRAFKILNCSGLARADFLIEGQTLEIYLNELNTMPGFTSISMYPKLWQASGLSYPQLLTKLIDLALEKHRDDAALMLTYTPKLPWHQS